MDLKMIKKVKKIELSKILIFAWFFQCFSRGGASRIHKKITFGGHVGAILGHLGPIFGLCCSCWC